MDQEKGCIDADKLLKKACSLYRQGKFRECLQSLKKVQFEVFNRKEWTLENNLLLCETKISHISNLNDIADKFEKLNEKVTGIPPSPQSLLQEISIGLNCSCILLSGHITHRLADACFQAGNILTNCIFRASHALGFYDENWSLMRVIPIQETFNSNILKITVKLTEKLLQKAKDNNGFGLLTLTCFVVAVLWISQHEVDAGLSLLEVLADNLNITDNSLSIHQEFILVDTSHARLVFPFCLLPQSQELGIKPIKAVTIFMTSLCYMYYKHDTMKALSLLDLPDVTDSSNTSCYANYLRGLIFYNKDEIDQAVQYFNLSITNTDMVKTIKAAGISMLGCCLAKQGKHHTAIAKLKEALSCNFSHLDSLLYVAHQYQALGIHDAEIRCLKYLCEALVVRGSQTASTQQTESLLQGPFITFTDKLNGTTVNLSYANYWLGKRCLLLHRFEEASDVLLDVLTQTRHSFRAPYELPSLLLLHRDCAFALLKCDKYDNCVTICNNGMEEAQKDGYKLQMGNSDITSTGKRIRETRELNQQTNEFQACYLEIMLCKADALLHMNQPLQSIEWLHGVFGVLENSIPLDLSDENTIDVRHPKRRKLESGDVRDSSAEKEDRSEFLWEKIKLLQIKSQAHLIRASVLQSIDKEKESLEELHQSLLCDPGNSATVYKYCRLLIKLGSKNVAVSNWTNFRRLEANSRSQGVIDDLSFYEVTDKELKDMDDIASTF